MGEINTESNYAYAYWLANIKGMGNRFRYDLLQAGSPEEVYRMNRKQLCAAIPVKKAELLLASIKEWDVIKEYEKVQRAEQQFLPFFHPHFPQRLLPIPNPPFALYTAGKLPEENMPSVAIIGARECSEYGRYAAAQCAGGLARAGVAVISGMARGIDGIGQKAAMDEGGRTYAVLGCGADICYPAENIPLYNRIRTEGGILSEYPPGTQPKAQLFPLRNRIISGLSDVVLIIEAREKSGTLITADMALEQGKEVYAIPGRVTDPLSRGCNRLIREGAGIMLSIREMLEETGIQVQIQTAKVQDERETGRQEQNKRETGRREQNNRTGTGRLLQVLDYYPKPIEVLQRESGMNYQEIIAGLLELCMQGKARQMSQGHYCRC